LGRKNNRDKTNHFGYSNTCYRRQVGCVV
jgi:hypothetical protein